MYSELMARENQAPTGRAFKLSGMITFIMPEQIYDPSPFCGDYPVICKTKTDDPSSLKFNAGPPYSQN
jgi:hypothetical protein